VASKSAEDELLDEIFAKFGHLTRWQLVDPVYQLPEWRDPNGSAFPIHFADILSAQNKKPEEIRAIEEEPSAIDQVECFLGAR
jgi:hypothetical protein